MASAGKDACEDSCSRSRVAAPFIERLLLPKVLGKLAFRLPVLAQGSISLVSEVSQYSQSSGRHRRSNLKLTVGNRFGF